jgi:hypothetical protein
MVYAVTRSSHLEGFVMSIVRMGISENKKAAEGWEAVFGKKKPAAKATKKPAPKKKPKK